MARPTGTITKSTVEAAFRAASAGESWSYPDPECPGLELRIRGGRVAWSFRGRLAGKQKRWTLGDHQLEPKAARIRAGEVRALLARGADPAPKITEWRTGVAPEQQVIVVAPPPSWEWNHAIDRFLKHMAGIARAATVRDYRKTLKNTPELQGFAGRRVADLRREEFEAAVEQVRMRGTKTHFKKVLVVCKRFTGWLGAGARRDQTGVQPNLLYGIKPEPAMRVEGRRRQNTGVPPARAIGRALIIARSGVLRPRPSLAIQAVIGTVQRRHTVVMMHSDEIRPLPGIGHNHAFNWFIPPAARKTADKIQSELPHQIPLVGWVAEVVDALERLRPAEDGGWYFPSRGDAEQPHMNESVLNHNIAALPGVGGVLSPHGLRRAFTSFGTENGWFTKNESKMILDHLEGEADDVTSGYYNLDPRIKKKAEMMIAWTRWCDEQAEAALAADPLLRDLDWLREQVYRNRYGDGEFEKKLAKARKNRHPLWDDCEDKKRVTE